MYSNIIRNTLTTPTIKLLILGLILLLAPLAFAQTCYQGSIPDAQAEGPDGKPLSAPDLKLTILFAGGEETNAIAISSESLRTRVNGEFSLPRFDSKKTVDVRATLQPTIGDFIASVEKGKLVAVQPRGKFVINKHAADDGTVGTTGVTKEKISGDKITLIPVGGRAECRKILYGELPGAAGKSSSSAPKPAAPPRSKEAAATTAPPGA